MKLNARLTFAAAALTATTAILIAAEARIGQPAGLTVHEWGTFTSIAGEDGNALEWDVLTGKDDLPRFVNDTGYHCVKFRTNGTIRMETPVLYFYTPRAMEARVHVSFAQGSLTEWYPQAENRSGLEWKLKVDPDADPAFPVESAPSRYYAARATDAAAVTAGRQHEKFLFYRGVGRGSVPLSARLSADGKVLVANRGPDPFPLVMLYENRGGRIGFRAAGAVADSVTLDRPALDGSLPELRSRLEGALVAQGLFPKEARAMLETWRDSWFEEGSRLIYIVPPRTVNAMVPLEVEPAPVQTTRVFVGRIELITPETVNAVEQAFLANDRSIAERYGRFIDPIMARIHLKDATALYRFRGGLATGGGCR